jgi:hypothetical protein
MADYSPTWGAIAGAWVEALKAVSGIGAAYSPYPDNAVDSLELPCVIINEPQEIGYSPFTYGAFTVAYTGEISLLVKPVDTGQARLGANDIQEITAAGLTLMVAVHQKRFLSGYASAISLGAGKVARFSPYDNDNRGHYAGLSIPYTVQMQYRS